MAKKLKLGIGLLDLIYPINSIYMSVSPINPSTLFGGTWVQLKDKFLLGAGDIYSNGLIGGSATHKLTNDEIPYHEHSQRARTGDGNLNPIAVKNTGGTTGAATQPYDYGWTNNGSGGYMPTYGTGGGKEHNNMPPYLVVYIWKRIS